MNIAFWGSSLVSAYWNGAATYYRGLLKALAKRGHRVTFYEPDAFGRQQHRDMAAPSWAEVVVYRPEADLSGLLEQSAAADLVVKASGIGVLDEFLCYALLSGRRGGGTVIYWDVDAPATLAALDAGEHPVLREAVGDFDAVFTYGGGPPVAAAYLQRGARQVRAIYNAVDPETHFPVPAVEAYRADATLLANRLPDREARLRSYFLDVAAAQPGYRFLLGGNGWSRQDVSSNVGLLGHVAPQDHNALNCSARLVLNVNREDMARVGYSPATRIFEAAGAGACIVSDAWEGIDWFLEPGAEILLAHDGAEVARWLCSVEPDQAQEIGRRARLRVLDQHTYDHRALSVEQALASLQQPAAAEDGRQQRTTIS
ncbi:MAG: CgeB family protein [Pseudomonadales bacterium]